MRKSSNSNSVAFHSGLGEKDTHNASVVGTMLNTIRERDRKLGWLAWRKTLKKTCGFKYFFEENVENTVFLHTFWSKALKNLVFYILAQTKHRFLLCFVHLFCRNHRVFLDICDTVRQGKNQYNKTPPVDSRCENRRIPTV